MFVLEPNFQHYETEYQRFKNFEHLNKENSDI